MAVIAIVPVDDAHSMRWQISVPSRRMARSSAPSARRTRCTRSAAYDAGDQAGFLGTWRLKQNKANDYLIDREIQASMQSCTGIMGIGDQDHAVVESMGDDLRPHQGAPGTSDLMVIRLRRLLLGHARRLREHGDAAGASTRRRRTRCAPAASCCPTAS